MILSSGAMDINGRQYLAIGITFTNRTGSIIYLGRARLREVPKDFPVPMDAARDMSGGWRELKFLNQSDRFVDHEMILHTNKSAVTCMAVTHAMSAQFFSFRPSLWRQVFRWPKYFAIEFIAMVGDKKYSVLSIY